MNDITLNRDQLSGEITAEHFIMSGTINPEAKMSGSILATVLKGLSAYELAVENGFVGSLEDWLEYLRATIEIGTVTSGQEVTIINVGTPGHAILDFTIPCSLNTLTQQESVIFYGGTSVEVV